MSSDMQQFLTFHGGKVEYAVDCSHVIEVIHCSALTHFSGLEGVFAGAIYRHASFLPIVDLRHSSACAPQSPDNHCRIVVLDAPGSEVGILVDHLGEIILLSTSAMHPLPPWMSGSKSPYVHGMSPINGRWLQILAPVQLLPDCTKATATSTWSSPPPPREAELPNVEDIVVRQTHTRGHTVLRKPPDTTDQEIQLQSTLNAHSIKELEEMAKAMSEGDFHRQVSSKIQGELENLAIYMAKTMSNLGLLEPSVRITAERDISAASEQLSAVVNSTEEATHTIISLTETLLDHQTALGEAVEKLKRQKYRSRDYQELLQQIERLHWEDEKTLMEIITNLSFQDLTGQCINQIVAMVTTVQAKLCDLIQAFGGKVQASAKEVGQETAVASTEEETGT